MRRALCLITIALGSAWAGGSLHELTSIYAMHEPFGLGIFPHQRYSAQIVRDAEPTGSLPSSTCRSSPSSGPT